MGKIMIIKKYLQKHFPDAYGENVVMRILDPSSIRQKLDKNVPLKRLID